MNKMLETGPEALWRMASRRPGLWLQPTDWKWLSALEVYGILGLGFLVRGIGLGQVLGAGPGDPRRVAGDYFDVSTFKMLEKYLGVFLFIFSSFCKYVGYLFKPFFSSGTGKEGISIPCLGFSGEGVL